MTVTDSRHICPSFEKTFVMLGKRWTGLIIRVLMDGPCRFVEIDQAIPGISDRMLAERLRELERNGIVERSVFAQIPVRIEYSLTEKGHSLAIALDPIQQWADQWISQEELQHG